MTIEPLSIRSDSDGLMISALYAAPDGDVRGSVLISHGMAEHKERYEPFQRALAEAGYASLVHDHRGHGLSVLSDDDLGHFDAQSLLRDLFTLIAHLRALHPAKPLALFGHSMGSLAARALTRADDSAIDALIVCGCPGENKSAGAGRALLTLLGALRGDRHRSKLFDRMSSGSFARAFAEGSAFAWLNSDAEAVRLYEADEKCGFLFTIKGYRALLDLMSAAYARDGWALGNKGLPILFISGADDPCMISREKLDAAVSHMKEHGYTDVTLKTYEGMRHEILLEPGRAIVFADVIHFLDHKLPQTEA